jgi:hypothetical protein
MAKIGTKNKIAIKQKKNRKMETEVTCADLIISAKGPFLRSSVA